MSATDGDSRIDVVHVIEADTAEVVCTFLESLDPGVIEASVLNDIQWGDSRPLTALVIEKIMNIARGVS